MKFTIEKWQKNAILRAKSEEVKPNEFARYSSIASAMVKYIRDPDNGGCGLAAPQIGTNKRIIAVSLLSSYDDEHYRTIAMINPEILEHSEELYLDEEWCLSVPGESGDVPRYKKIKVKYADPDGKGYVRELEWLAARIVQHEIDHLDGILFTDRIKQTSPSALHAL